MTLSPGASPDLPEIFLEEDVTTIRARIVRLPKKPETRREQAESIKKDVADFMREKLQMDIHEKLTPEMWDEIIDFAIGELDLNPRQSIRNIIIFHPHIQALAREKKKTESVEIPANRQRLLKQIHQQFPALQTESWNINPYTDESLNKEFDVDGGFQHLTTYFDCAQFGLVSKKKRKAAIELMLRPQTEYFFPEYEDFLANEVLQALNPVQAGEEPRFQRRGFHFVRSAGEAFNYLFWAYLKPEESATILVTSEEYGEFTEMMDKQNLHVVRLPEYQDPEQYEKAIQEAYAHHSIDFVLASDITRRGTRIPLSLFNKNRPKKSTMILVDGCQAPGRKDPDFEGVRPDVYFSSFHKGSDVGGNTAILALSESFLEQHGDRIAISGTAGTNPMARAAIGASPQIMRLVDQNPGQIKKEDMENKARLLNLSRKLVALSRLVPQIRILFPKHPEDPQNLSGIFELEVEGVKREELCRDFLKNYAIFVSDHYFQPSGPQAFRIAMHPHMNDDSLKLLIGGIMEFVNREKGQAG